MRPMEKLDVVIGIQIEGVFGDSPWVSVASAELICRGRDGVLEEVLRSADDWLKKNRAGVFKVVGGWVAGAAGWGWWILWPALSLTLQVQRETRSFFRQGPLW